MHLNGRIRLSHDDQLSILQGIVYIEKHYADKINAIQICMEVNISQRKLQAGMKELTLLNVEQYIHKVRMEKAKQLLEENRSPLKLVAKHSGFHDQSYFGKVFKKCTNMTPEEYRIGCLKYQKTT